MNRQFEKSLFTQRSLERRVYTNRWKSVYECVKQKKLKSLVYSNLLKCLFRYEKMVEMSCLHKDTEKI